MFSLRTEQLEQIQISLKIRDPNLKFFSAVPNVLLNAGHLVILHLVQRRQY